MGRDGTWECLNCTAENDPHNLGCWVCGADD